MRRMKIRASGSPFSHSHGSCAARPPSLHEWSFDDGSEGVEVEVLAEGPSWTQVRVQGRSGFVPAGAVGVVR